MAFNINNLKFLILIILIILIFSINIDPNIGKYLFSSLSLQSVF